MVKGIGVISLQVIVILFLLIGHADAEDIGIRKDNTNLLTPVEVISSENPSEQTGCGCTYYDIENYRIYPPIGIKEEDLGTSDSVIRILFPLNGTKDISGFFGYILAVKSDGQNNYSFVSNGAFTYEDFKSRCTTGTRVIILTEFLKDLSEDETVSESGDGENENGTTEEPQAIIGGVKREGERPWGKLELSPFEGYIGWNVNGLLVEIRLEYLPDVPRISDESYIIWRDGLTNLKVISVKTSPICGKDKYHSDLGENGDWISQANRFIYVKMKGELPEGFNPCDNSDYTVFALAKVSEEDPFYKPGYIVQEIIPSTGEITHVGNTELYSTIYFSSNWYPDDFKGFINGPIKVTVTLNGKELKETVASKGNDVIKIAEGNLANGSVTIGRPVKKGDKIKIEITEENQNGESPKYIIIAGEPKTIYGLAFKDERLLSAKFGADNVGDVSNAKLDLDFKYYWFIRGRHRIRVKGASEVSNSPTNENDNLNVRGDWMGCFLPVARKTVALEVGFTEGAELWYYPEPKLNRDDIFWFDLASGGTFTFYWGDLTKQENLFRAVAEPEFHYGPYRPDLTPAGENVLTKYTYIPGSVFYNFHGLQLGLDIAATYVFDYERVSAIDVDKGWHGYWASVLKIDPSYVKGGFPITLDSQSMLALNLKLENGRKPPLMNDISSRMSFEIEFAPNIGTKKEDGE